MSRIPSSKTDVKPAVGAKTSTTSGHDREVSEAVRKVERSYRVRRWSLAAADTISLLIGIAVASAFGSVDSSNVIWLLGAIPVWIFVAKLYNLYDRDHRRIQHSTFDEIPALLATAAITVVFIKAITVLFSTSMLASSALITVGGVACIATLALRASVRRLYWQITPEERTVVVGSGEKAAMVSRRLDQQLGRGIQLAGYVADSPHELAEGSSEIPAAAYFGTTSQLTLIARKHQITRIVIADDSLDTRAIGRVINDCRDEGLAVTLVPANQQVLGPDTELNRYADVPMLDFHFSRPPRSTMAIKRVVDITVAAGALTLTLPLLIVSAIAIKIDSKGPVFFCQVRIGKNGRRFTMYKLRTMVADAEARLDDLIDLDNLDEPAFKIPNDPRITRVGRYLRRSSLDEIPQFINVLSGKMSLVGPRPEEEAVVALYDERQRQRLSVKPGLTGPMQVYGRGSLSFEERLALERDYLDNLTVSGDIAILLRTPGAVIKGDGAY